MIKVLRRIGGRSDNLPHAVELNFKGPHTPTPRVDGSVQMRLSRVDALELIAELQRKLA